MNKLISSIILVVILLTVTIAAADTAKAFCCEDSCLIACDANTPIVESTPFYEDEQGDDNDDDEGIE